MKRFLLILLFVGILIAGFLGISLYYTLYKSLPVTEGSVRLENLNEPVDIHWDSYGTPYIYASGEEDLYFALGYVHARDRLWQMTLSQLAAEGRFAEFLGEELVPIDRYQRTLGIWRAAGKIYEESPDSLLRFLDRYADGVNQYVRENGDKLPVEFSLTEMKPIEWTPLHSLALVRLMAWDQNLHWWSELSVAYLAEELSENERTRYFPDYDDSFPTLLNDDESAGVAELITPLYQLEQDRRRLLSVEGEHVGSNAWAVAGSKTVHGRPILSGDPHMGLSIPGFWYDAHLSAPGFSITGATIPGLPFVVLGHNGFSAWTITSMMADDTDFFLEKMDPENPEFYISDSLSAPVTRKKFEYQDEIIRVKGGDDQFLRIKHTENGPVINDIQPEPSKIDDYVVSMKWAGHRVSHEAWSIYKMNHSRSLSEFEEAVSLFKSPAMNFTYADTDNNIAIFSAAGLPVRDHHPLMFRKGWDPGYQWRDDIPFGELPHSVNPSKGYVSHANNKLHTDQYPHYLSSFWAPPSRIIRINQQLDRDEPFTAEFMKTMQNDTYSDHARNITDIILPLLRSADHDGKYELPLSYLENWNYYYNRNSTAATIFDKFFMNVSEHVLKRDMDDPLYDSFVRMQYLPIQVVSNYLRESAALMGTGEGNIELMDLVTQSMDSTLVQLEEIYGSEPVFWRWENVNTLTLQPPLLGQAAKEEDAPGILKLIVNNFLSRGPFPVDGHAMTINKSQYSWSEPFKMNVGPSIRRIIDFSDPGRIHSILPTGQSGNPMSANYGDQTNMWLDGRYRFIYQDSTFFNEISYSTLVLLPEE